MDRRRNNNSLWMILLRSSISFIGVNTKWNGCIIPNTMPAWDSVRVEVIMDLIKIQQRRKEGRIEGGEYRCSVVMNWLLKYNNDCNNYD